MISFLIIFFIVVILEIIILGIIISNIELDIEECDISYNIEIPNKFKIKKLKVNIKLFLFKKINVIKIKIYKNYCVIFGIKIHLNILKKLKDDEEYGMWFILKNIWKLNPKIKNINIEIEAGTEDTLLTTFLIPTASMIIFPIISKNMKLTENNNENVDYPNCNIKIIPKYINSNNLTLKGNLQIAFDTMRTLFFISKHKKIKV